MPTSSDAGLLIRNLSDIRSFETHEGGNSLELARTYHTLGMIPEADRRVWDAAVDCLRARLRERT